MSTEQDLLDVMHGKYGCSDGMMWAVFDYDPIIYEVFYKNTWTLKIIQARVSVYERKFNSVHTLAAFIRVHLNK